MFPINQPVSCKLFIQVNASADTSVAIDPTERRSLLASRSLAFCIFLMSFLAVVGCSHSTVEPAHQPAFKGVELYSWQVKGEWNFSILPGTNRLKNEAEITHPSRTLVGTATLKENLQTLVQGESVFWRNLADQPVLPSMEKDLVEFCAALGVSLERF